MDPKITVIIPTRERCDTLFYTLKSCLHQNNDNLSILVSDNYSQDNTREVVFEHKDPRLRYINTGKRLSMSQNWEFALSQVTDGFVLFLGDDDALLPESMNDLVKILINWEAAAVCWDQAYYKWPEKNLPGTNILNIPLRRTINKQLSKAVLQSVIEFKKPYTKLPVVYKGLVNYSILEKIKKKSGRFFNSMIPDIYSGIAVAAVLPEYVYSARPYTINGASSHSIGTSTLVEKIDPATPSQVFLSEDNIPFHPQLTYAPSVPIFVAECFLQVLDNVDATWILPDLRYDLLLLKTMEEAVHYHPTVFDSVVQAVKEISNTHNLSEFSKNLMSRYNINRNYNNSKNPPPTINLKKRELHFDCYKFNITNVYDASVFCYNILNLVKYNYFSPFNALKSMLKYNIYNISDRIDRFLN